MIIVKKKEFTQGLIMAILFFVVLGVMFSPIFNGENAFRASDKLFNSISKGSTDYFPKLKEENAFKGQDVELTLKISEKEAAANAAKILAKMGAAVETGDGQLTVKGDLGAIVDVALADAQAMFYNKGDEVKGRYDIEERHALYAWWKALKESVRSLKKQKKFKEAAYLDEVINRGVEVGYNYYKVEPESAKSKALILVLALIFYVVYTLWWGFAVFFLTEGFGLELSGGHKKES